MSSLEKAHIFSDVSAKLVLQYESDKSIFEKEDLDRVITDGFLIKEAVFTEKLNEQEAIERVSDILKWRKSYGITRRKDDYFPLEFYQLAFMFPYNKDKVI